jgi:hypothetical protein
MKGILTLIPLGFGEIFGEETQKLFASMHMVDEENYKLIDLSRMETE